MILPPLRKKTAQERAAARNEDGDLTIALFGDLALLDESADAAMQPQKEDLAEIEAMRAWKSAYDLMWEGYP